MNVKKNSEDFMGGIVNYMPKEKSIKKYSEELKKENCFT